MSALGGKKAGVGKGNRKGVVEEEGVCMCARECAFTIVVIVVAVAAFPWLLINMLLLDIVVGWSCGCGSCDKVRKELLPEVQSGLENRSVGE